MANIKQRPSHGLPDFYISLASFCLMLCMVITLLGIKFRWFKHRMVFEQIPNNGVPNGTIDGVETVSYRKKTKPSQQFLEPVIVHGVFRQRREEDIQYERPKSLPPIRIRKSSHVPPALSPPRRRSHVQSEILENLPRPESPSQISSSTSNSAGNSPDVLAKNFSSEYKSNEMEPHVDCQHSSQKFNKNEPIYAEPKKRYTPKKSSIHESKSKATHSKELNERRPTGFVRLTDDERKELELSAGAGVASTNEIDLIKFNLKEEKLELDNKESLDMIASKSMERRITFYDESPENNSIDENWSPESDSLQGKQNRGPLAMEGENANKPGIERVI